MKPIPVIVGPTASGKTAVGIALARKIGGEVISADSRQVYKYLSVGTAKPLNTRDIPYHLIDFLDPKDRFSAGDFVRLAKKTIKDIRNRGKTPIIVGGTGLYIKALIDGLAPLPPANDKIRNELSNRIKKVSLNGLHVELAKIDPVSARKIPPNNVQRLMRAMEVYKLTGIPLSEWHKKTKRPTNEKFRVFGLNWPKDKLERNIVDRSGDILPGMLRETRLLLKKGYSEVSPGLQALGYRDALAYIAGEINKYELLGRVIISTRQLAKRQMTWFRGDKRIRWIPCRPGFNPDKIAGVILRSPICIGDRRISL